MDTLWTSFVNCRAHFPYVSDEVVGATSIRTAPYYSARGFDVWLCFPKALTKKNVRDFNGIGHWINQNFIVRLCALLEWHKVLVSGQEIDSTLAGGKHVWLVRQLRNVFAHTAGRCNRRKREHKKILKTMGTMLGVDTRSATDFPLGINEVLKPLFNGCKEYVKAWGKRRH